MVRASLIVLVLLSACVETDRPLRGDDTDTTVAPDTTNTPDATDTADVPDVEPCDEQGTTRCAGTEATQICDDGQWQTVSCPSDRICVDFGGAECLSATGESTCRDVLYCYALCQVNFAEDLDGRYQCLVACFISGSGTAQSELGLVTSCIDEKGCEEDGTSTLECIDDGCSLQLALCYFEETGRKGCGDILECAEGCDDGDATCWRECGDDASADAQAEFAILDLCVQYTCFGQLGDDCLREATQAGGLCFQYAARCASPL